MRKCSFVVVIMILTFCLSSCNSFSQTKKENYHVKPVISYQAVGEDREKTHVDYIIEVYSSKKDVEDIRSAVVLENEQYKTLVEQASTPKIEIKQKDGQYIAFVSGTIVIKANAKNETHLGALTPFLGEIELTDKNDNIDTYDLNL